MVFTTLKPGVFARTLRSLSAWRLALAERNHEPAAPRIAPAAITWSDRAIADLEAIGDHLSRDNPVAAAGWVMKLISVAEGLASAPLAGRRVPELGRDDIRETFLRTYRVVYRVCAQRQVEIVTIFEGHRLLRAGEGQGG
ncbi:MAG: type II toxin-antitoxin system RelE/ParE family toxin [Myxococcales bacterium]|nr:type II toxin-antitoxin system RelE/ParE family toxin [Myxococcales bacterium]